VFKKENEEVVEFIQKQGGLTLMKMQLLKGYEIKADTMFAALFKNRDSQKTLSDVT
jgi:16S rRNA (cytosine967-C5)-methyltransferase